MLASLIFSSHFKTPKKKRTCALTPANLSDIKRVCTSGDVPQLPLHAGDVKIPDHNALPKSPLDKAANGADNTRELRCHHALAAASPPNVPPNNVASDTDGTPESSRDGAAAAILPHLRPNIVAYDADSTASPHGQSTMPAAFIFGGGATPTLLMMHGENAELRKTNSDLKRKCKNLLRLHEQARSKVRSLNKKMKLAQQELNALRSSTFLAADQTKDLATKTRIRKWSRKTIQVALQIKHACATTGYEFLRSSYLLLQTGP